jgi:hypothetical protein
MATKLSKQAATELLSHDRDQLYMMLGMRSLAIQADHRKQASYQPVVVYSTHMGPKDDLIEIGQRMFNKLQRQTYGLVCGNKKEDKEDRDKILVGLGISAEAAVIALTSVLIGSFGLAAAFAGVVAALIIKRFAEPTLEEGRQAMCALWKENLPSEEG